MRPRVLPAPVAGDDAGDTGRLAQQHRSRDGEIVRRIAGRARDALFRFAFRPAPHLEYVSPAIEALTGYAPDDYYADPALFERTLHPDDARALLRARDVGARVLVRFVGRDGAIAWGECAITAVPGDHGSIDAIEGIVRDVTARVAAEQAALASEARAGAVIAGLPDTVFVIDSAGFFRDHLPADGARPLFAGSCIGRNLTEVLPESVAVASLRAVHAALRTDARTRLRFSLGAGDERGFEAWFAPVQPDRVLEFVREWSEDDRSASAAMQSEGGGPERREPQPAPHNPYRLTYRELTVLQHVARGSADKQIADELGISRYTVNKHVAAILSKMDAPSRTAAGVRAVREGLAESTHSR